MKEYHKIQTLLVRDPETHKVIWPGDFRLPEYGYLSCLEWIWTEKIDGTNIRVIWDGERVEFRGRTDRAQIPPKLMIRLMNLFGDTAKWRGKFNYPVTLYGEGYGAGIQKGGGNYGPGQDFVLFDVHIGMWLQRHNVVNIADYFGVRAAPYLGIGSLTDAIEFTRGGFYSDFGDFPAEGLVCRPRHELSDRRGNRIIAKIKTKDF